MSHPVIDAIETRHRAEDRRQQTEDIRKWLATPEGRRILVALMFQAGVYTHSRQDDNLAYYAGRRDLALELMRDANEACPEMVLKARLERHETIVARNAEIKQAIENANAQRKGNEP